MKKILPGIVLAVATANAVAVPVTFDADNYAVGTNLSSASVSNDFQLQAVSRSLRDQPLEYSDVIVQSAPKYNPGLGDEFPVSGFGDNRLGSFYYGVHLYDPFSNVPQSMPLYPFAGLGIRFFEPVRYVNFHTLTFADAPYIRAYDTTGNLIEAAWGRLNWSGSDGCLCSVSSIGLERDQADIAYILVGGSGSGTSINEFTYDVPAPSSLALLLLGAAGGVVSRTRKLKAK